jgi:hypothetical protein
MPSELKCTSKGQATLFLNATESTNKHYIELKKQGDELYGKMMTHLNSHQLAPNTYRPKGSLAHG